MLARRGGEAGAERGEEAGAAIALGERGEEAVEIIPPGGDDHEIGRFETGERGAFQDLHRPGEAAHLDVLGKECAFRTLRPDQGEALRPEQAGGIEASAMRALEPAHRPTPFRGAPLERP